MDEERERKWNELTLDHYYMAQVALEVVRMGVNADAAKSLSLDQFLIKFKEKKVEKPKTPEELAEYTKQQKILFASIFGAPLPPNEL